MDCQTGSDVQQRAAPDALELPEKLFETVGDARRDEKFAGAWAVARAIRGHAGEVFDSSCLRHMRTFLPRMQSL